MVLVLVPVSCFWAIDRKRLKDALERESQARGLSEEHVRHLQWENEKLDKLLADMKSMNVEIIEPFDDEGTATPNSE